MMARDPRRHPEAMKADFSSNPPFPKEDVLYVLGSRWTQRFVVDKGGKLQVKAAIWSITGKSWDTSYWVDKPWTNLCQGCHVTGFEIHEDKPRFTELAVGCEACHGPGKAHADSGGSGPIVNPADLNAARRQMICESCHTSGHDRTGQFRFPLGYVPGRDLTSYYKGLTPKPGQDNDTFAGDGSYNDRHRQWLYWVDSYFNARGLTCDICKNFRERKEGQSNTKVKMTVSEHCMTCHDESWPKKDVHARHLKADVGCDQCHLPALAPGGKSYSIHDHKFLFGKPVSDKPFTPQQACVRCHKQQTAAAGRGG
jgi:hypothetical protein